MNKHTLAIHYNHNHVVTTPDNVALQARVRRCKRMLRKNVQSHQVNTKKHLRLPQLDLMAIYGLFVGVLYVGALLFVPIV